MELEFLIQSPSDASHCLNAAHSVHSRGSKLTPVNCLLSTNFQAGGIFFFSLALNSSRFYAKLLPMSQTQDLNREGY